MTSAYPRDQQRVIGFGKAQIKDPSNSCSCVTLTSALRTLLRHVERRSLTGLDRETIAQL